MQGGYIRGARFFLVSRSACPPYAVFSVPFFTGGKGDIVSPDGYVDIYLPYVCGQYVASPLVSITQPLPFSASRKAAKRRQGMAYRMPLPETLPYTAKGVYPFGFPLFVRYQDAAIDGRTHPLFSLTTGGRGQGAHSPLPRWGEDSKGDNCPLWNPGQSVRGRR